MEWLDPRQGWLPMTAFLLRSDERDAELARLTRSQLPAAFKYTLALAASVSPNQVRFCAFSTFTLPYNQPSRRWGQGGLLRC